MLIVLVDSVRHAVQARADHDHVEGEEAKACERWKKACLLEEATRAIPSPLSRRDAVSRADARLDDLRVTIN